MAIPDYKVLVGVRDSESNISTMTFYSNALTDAAARSLATDIRDVVVPLTDGAIASVDLVTNIYTSSVIPSGNIDNEAAATFTFSDVFGRAMILSVPAFKRSLLLTNTDSVDMADSAVAAFTSLMTGDALVTSHDDDIVAVRSGVESWRKRNKRR